MKRWQFLLILWVVLLAVFGGATVRSQKWEQVAILVSDVSRDETELAVEFSKSVTLDRPIMIESRDRSIKENYSVKHVYGSHILLKEKLKRPFLSGARIYQ